jgi:hypothetical protein
MGVRVVKGIPFGQGNLCRLRPSYGVLQIPRATGIPFGHTTGIPFGHKWRKGFFTLTGKRGLDNCGKKPKKGILAQELRLFAAALTPGAAVEGELLRQGEKGSTEYKVLSSE